MHALAVAQASRQHSSSSRTKKKKGSKGKLSFSMIGLRLGSLLGGARADGAADGSTGAGGGGGGDDREPGIVNAALANGEA